VVFVPGTIEKLCCKEGIEMLFLSRKRGEELGIGNGISVKVLEMRGDRVSLGFIAPSDIPIQRTENHRQGRSPMCGSDSLHRLTTTETPNIAETARQRLRASPYKVLQRVTCESKHGVLFLRGRLFSFHEKQIAQKTVAEVSGVTQVVNEIEVDQADAVTG
jgi:carbon storage regulator